MERPEEPLLLGAHGREEDRPRRRLRETRVGASDREHGRHPLGVVVPTVAAIIGTLMVSYTSTKAMADMGHRYLGPVVGAGRGRDLRLLILSVAALLAVVHPLFLLGGVVVIAVLTLLVVAWRLWSRAATRVGRPIDLGSVQAVVFDFDGTVADTMGVLSDAAVALLTETYGMSAETAWQAYRETTGMDFAAQLERIAPGGRCNAELADRFADRKPDLVRDCLTFPRTLDALARLRNLGRPGWRRRWPACRSPGRRARP